MEQQPPSSGKRTDVGYKRPPPEHQFKKGHKPKPRKPKAKQPESTAELLRRVLHEERRVAMGKQVKWMPAAEILINKAFELAEKGNATMRRRLMELQMRTDKPVEEGAEPYTLVLNGDSTFPPW